MSIFKGNLCGRYTPVVSGLVNVNTYQIGAVSNPTWLYTVIGFSILVSGLVQVNPIAAGVVNMDFSLPVPIAFNWPDTNGLNGNGTSGAAVNVASLQSVAGLQIARMYILAPGAGNVFWRIMFNYLLF